MPSGTNTTESEKEQIKLLHYRGLGTGQIARELGMKRQTVQKWVARMLGTAHAKQPKTAVSIKSAEADYSRAKITRHAFRPPPDSRICNGSMTEPFDPNKHITVL